jgi:hypothetical protein
MSKTMLWSWQGSQVSEPQILVYHVSMMKMVTRETLFSQA